MKKVFALIAVLLSLVSCKEDKGPSEIIFTESPRFYVNTSLNGLPLNLTAGKDDYQMYTSYQIEDSVLTMKGILARDSQNLTRALVLKLRGADFVGAANPLNVDSILRQGAIAFADPSGQTVVPGHFDYYFFADSVSSHSSLMWNTPHSQYYGDSCSIIGLSRAEHTVFNVEMTSDGSLSCTPSVKHSIQTGQQCKAQIHVLRSTNSELEVEVQERIGRIKTVNWQVAGQAVGSGHSLQYSVVGFQPGYRIRANIQFESGCTELIEKVVLPGSPSCDINIDYQMQEHKRQNPHNLATVELLYYDEEGKAYSSSYANTQGNFVVESISSYHDANSLHNHRRFSFSGSAVLKSSDGSTLQLNSIFGSFAVAHP